MTVDLNAPDHPDDGLLEYARMAASTNWEESFAADMLRLRGKLGLRFIITARQRASLKKIAGIEE